MKYLILILCLSVVSCGRKKEEPKAKKPGTEANALTSSEQEKAKKLEACKKEDPKKVSEDCTKLLAEAAPAKTEEEASTEVENTVVEETVVTNTTTSVDTTTTATTVVTPPAPVIPVRKTNTPAAPATDAPMIQSLTVEREPVENDRDQETPGAERVRTMEVATIKGGEVSKDCKDAKKGKSCDVELSKEDEVIELVGEMSERVEAAECVEYAIVDGSEQIVRLNNDGAVISCTVTDMVEGKSVERDCFEEESKSASVVDMLVDTTVMIESGELDMTTLDEDVQILDEDRLLIKLIGEDKNTIRAVTPLAASECVVPEVVVEPTPEPVPAPAPTVEQG